MDRLRLTAAWPDTAPDHELLDENDPHAGDDVAWFGDEFREPAFLPPLPAPLRFWRGLAWGLLFSAVAWSALAAAALGLYALLSA